MDIDTTIIGAGVVGLAVAAELAARGVSVIVLERHERFGQETSSHNSEVLHAGLYYPTGSLKARLCLEGNGILRQLAREGALPLKLIGKLVVGNQNETGSLEALLARATDNGVEGIRLLSRQEIRRMEPHLSSTVALFSAHTGILDSHALMRLFLTRALDHGADIAFQTEVIGVEPITGGFRLHTRGGDGSLFSLDSERVVNAAGLGSDQIAAMAGIDVDAAGYRLHPCKGDYFSTSPRCWRLVNHLIYPAPKPKSAGLGIHVTLDLTGRMRLGPDAVYVSHTQIPNARVDPCRKEAFASAVQQYLPAISVDDLEPEFCGIRPKLQGPGEPFRDFVVTDETSRGLPGWVNLIGIESPGLTAAPAIAREVARIMTGKRRTSRSGPPSPLDGGSSGNSAVQR